MVGSLKGSASGASLSSPRRSEGVSSCTKAVGSSRRGNSGSDQGVTDEPGSWEGGAQLGAQKGIAAPDGPENDGRRWRLACNRGARQGRSAPHSFSGHDQRTRVMSTPAVAYK